MNRTPPNRFSIHPRKMSTPEVCSHGRDATRVPCLHFLPWHQRKRERFCAMKNIKYPVSTTAAVLYSQTATCRASRRAQAQLWKTRHFHASKTPQQNSVPPKSTLTKPALYRTILLCTANLNFFSAVNIRANLSLLPIRVYSCPFVVA